MTFQVYQHHRNATDIARRLGYKPIARTPQGELNCVRPLHGDYPRFHIYLKEENDILTFNIHLDQKKPSYQGSAAHGGDYESETVKDEVERIKGILFEE